MNTKNLKAYAPKARSQFIEAIKKRAAQFGIYQDKIAEVQFEGGAAIIEGRAFTKKQGDQRKRLEQRVEEKGFDLFIREMAYTWFNRLAAIRYMELHDYLDHGFRVLSNPTNADSLPEILDHASDVVDSLDPDKKYLDKNHIIELQLAGNKEEELYRELLLGQCHRLYNIMPFMFEAIDDATELLLPDNLTKTDSILKGLVNEIPEEDWSEIEVIGWLYQSYISEHKDSIIGKVVKSEDIPAATQLFTPNWIVKYLVQNSLGRQWLATYPESELKGKMEYYIEPAEQSDDVIEQLKAITPTSIDPEQIKVLDPAAGSGHILVEVYEVLREIYLERGYRLREIPELILTKNIYGLDIDNRAAQLAGFALIMKAREDDRRIFERSNIQLNVFSLQSTKGLDVSKLWQSLNLEGNQKQGSTGGLFDSLDGVDAFVQPTGIYKEYFELLQTLKSLFLQAKTLGSLIQIDNEHLQSLVALKELLQSKEKGSDPSAKQAANEILPFINQSIVLAEKYDVVVANPPYMGNNGMNSDLKEYARANYIDSRTDLFSIYIERSIKFGVENCQISLLTPYVWMFIASFEALREKFLNENTLSSLIQLEYNAFEPACIPVCTFSFCKVKIKNYMGTFIRLSDFTGHTNQAPKTIEAIKNKECGWIFDIQPDDFSKIPGSPIAYWQHEKQIELFEKSETLKISGINTATGLQTGDNGKFIRKWFEVSQAKLNTKWFPLNDGGPARKWYGNYLSYINWENDGELIKNTKSSVVRNPQFYFNEGATWNRISSTYFFLRYLPKGFIFDQAGDSLFTDKRSDLFMVLGFLNSSVGNEIMKVLCPTLNATAGSLEKFPYPQMSPNSAKEIETLVNESIGISKGDWNANEFSWDFERNFFAKANDCNLLSEIYSQKRSHEELIVDRLHQCEMKINDVFLTELNLKEYISNNVEIEQISLISNPYFRYSRDNNASNFRWICQSDNIIELLSYTIGCMMGRYSLDRDGLVYAHSGNTGFKELIAEDTYKTFPADDDGIVPLAPEDWLFGDDATARFREFVKIVWGEEHLQENLGFVAESLCLHALKPAKNESANDTVRRYFSKQFYKDHCKTYKKRPIYWLFSSGKEKAFECLVYLHRYNEGTLSRMRTEYVTPLMGKYEAQHSLLAEQKLEATTTEARRIEKELKSLEKKQAELRTFDEQLKHYAEMRITLDLDDGVKANYGKFGNLLADVKAIHGKAVK